MDKKIKLKGKINLYFQWPFILVVLLVLTNVGVYFLDKKSGLLVSLGLILYILIVCVLYFRSRSLMFNELISFATQYGQIQKAVLEEFQVPYALLSADGKFLWMNERFQELCGKDKYYSKSIITIFPDISLEMFPNKRKNTEIEITFGERDYRMNMQKIKLEPVFDDSEVIQTENPDSYMIAVYMFDETEVNTYIREKEEDKLVTGLIYLDNYEEALDSVEDVRRSLLIALIDRKINKYISNIDGLVKKLEKDKYFVVMRNRSLEQLKSVKFNLLDEVKTVNIGNEMAVTISMGIGLNAGSYAQNAEYARIAIELALGRGGDQVVIKDDEKIFYYGGKSQSVEKNTRVKARVKAHALKEFMSSKDKVVVMGHKITDVDSFGAAIGIYRAAKSINKKAYIVIENPTKSIQPLMDGFRDNPDYDTHIFVNHHEAKELVDDNAVLVVVDTNKPNYTECEDLLSLTRTIVVLDHHRQGREVIRNAVLSYIEPYASSACELVAEILQYFGEEIRIRNIEADALYAGIMVDTNNFMAKTGVRTFEAAAFLRRCGADVTRVRKLFRDSMADFKARAEAIRRSEIFMGSHAIGVCPSDGLASPTIVCAQAANELLNIDGIKASYVLTDYKDTIYISARAIDEVNVQLIMERLGGGGHLNIAGAQLEHRTMEESIQILKDTIKEMTEGGDI
ncbi:MAG: DHH family phosphoesterase [Lachnospiraceae bacterium]|nr:DHH family phosphoesterase [Lachnospiraceae bacterium]MDD3617013.1 DHH family phosphoesterase [Lachnospiraceae bacterium]